MTYKCDPIIAETSVNCSSHSKMMTAVASHLFLPELISEMPPASAKDILYGQTMILFLYLNQFYKTEQGVGSSPNRNSCCIVRSRLNILLLCSHRTNRTCLRDEL